MRGRASGMRWEGCSRHDLRRAAIDRLTPAAPARISSRGSSRRNTGAAAGPAASFHIPSIHALSLARLLTRTEMPIPEQDLPDGGDVRQDAIVPDLDHAEEADAAPPEAPAPLSAAGTPEPAAAAGPPRGPLGNLAVSFSGGGYRAAGFHLGVLRLLERVGLLPSVAALSTVSGGTIVGA